MKTRRLLNKTLLYYLVFGGLVLLTAIPMYYLFYSKYYLHEIDEYLLERKNELHQKSLETLTPDEIFLWNRFNDNDETILPDNGQTKEYQFVTKNEDATYRVLYARIHIGEGDYILRIRLNMQEVEKIIQSGIILQIVLFSCIMIGFIIITRVIYERLWKPFYQVLSLTEQFNIQQGEAPYFPPTDTQEFDQLNRALEKLIGNNLQAYKIQKEFTENASHEMQTPLAVFRSKLDMLLQQPELTEEQLAIIQALHEATSRLVRMNKNLLLLAQMDNLQFPDRQMLDVPRIVKESLSFLSGQIEAANITTETHIVDKTPALHANKLLSESLVNNLLTNAIRHNVPGGKIRVELEANRLVVANIGAGKPLDNTILFRRFGRMNPVAKGSGLGLAIARQICSLYGWQIHYDFEEGMHRFTVAFLNQS